MKNLIVFVEQSHVKFRNKLLCKYILTPFHTNDAICTLELLDQKSSVVNARSKKVFHSAINVVQRFGMNILFHISSPINARDEKIEPIPRT